MKTGRVRGGELFLQVRLPRDLTCACMPTCAYIYMHMRGVTFCSRSDSHAILESLRSISAPDESKRALLTYVCMCVYVCICMYVCQRVRCSRSRSRTIQVGSGRVESRRVESSRVETGRFESPLTRWCPRRDHPDRDPHSNPKPQPTSYR